MARFRVWLRGYVLNLLRDTGRKDRNKKGQNRKTLVSVKDLNISAPILVKHNGVDFIMPSNTLPRSLSVQNVMEPHPDREQKHMSAEMEVPQSITVVIDHPPEDEKHDIEESVKESFETAPSLWEDTDTLPEVLTPCTPQRRRSSHKFLQRLSTYSDTHNWTELPRPDSYLDPNSSIPNADLRAYADDGGESSSSHSSNEISRNRYSVMADAKRVSHYSVMSKLGEQNRKKINRGSVLSDNKRGSYYSTMSRDEFRDEWADKRMSKRLSRRMSWGLETYQTHASTYAPLRI
jgi:hypothetical protein